MKRRLPLSACVLALLLIPGLASLSHGQARLGTLSPLDEERLAPEEPAGPLAPVLPPPVLPPLELPADELDLLSGDLRVVVREIRIVGSTIFSDAELAEQAAPYTNREINAGELEQLRYTITRMYIDRGYVNSGAIVPDQDVSDGAIEIQIIEGTLEDIEIESRWFRSAYLRKRVELGAGVPLRVQDIEERLQILQNDPRIERLTAELGPGTDRGQAVLRLRVDEKQPFRLEGEFNNWEPASIGELGGRFWVGQRNLTGWGDSLNALFKITDGLRDIDGRYRIPLNALDTWLELRARYTDSEVVEEPFNLLSGGGVKGETQSYSIGVGHPFYRTPSMELSAGARFVWRKSKTFAGGALFPIPGAGSEDGETIVAPLRIWQQYVYRDRAQVVALRSTFSIGLDVLGAVDEPTDFSILALDFGEQPDGTFFHWISQIQYIRRFKSLWDTELLLRTDIQVSADPLVPIEQFSLGGPLSVRGYRINTIVRDSGTSATVEVRIPVLRLLGRVPDGQHALYLVPFIDVGNAWNQGRDTPNPNTIWSPGIGLRYRFGTHLLAEFMWAADIVDLDRAVEPDDDNAQDHGIYFRLHLTAF
jgi:hemolysin activation/secretion protein